MTKPPLLAAAMLAASALPLLAEQFCELDESVRFACTFDGGAKAVEVCDAFWLDGDQAQYGFFRPGQPPELAITQDLASLYYTPWNGMGGEPWSSVTFNAPGGDYRYDVWSSGETGGITVMKGATEVATLTCDPGSLSHDLDALIERIETAQISP
ncbi:hypothetical protein [Ponticoccus sp. (in: a-proteobacteria)]|uniref:hypothetical protein n=1 Tax=Ponticoccus sp. (in: a-proteobacteria) TaxID=1925025 RepID=UPI003AB2E97A